VRQTGQKFGAVGVKISIVILSSPWLIKWLVASTETTLGYC